MPPQTKASSTNAGGSRSRAGVSRTLDNARKWLLSDAVVAFEAPKKKANPTPLQKALGMSQVIPGRLFRGPVAPARPPKKLMRVVGEAMRDWGLIKEVCSST